MLSCKEVAERASALVDGDLSPWEAVQMRVHLAMCKGCERFVGQVRTTRDLTSVPMPEDMMTEADDGRINAVLAQLQADRARGG